MKPLLVFLAVATLSSVSNAQTLFVSPTGNDNYPGTLDSSFKTIPRALASIQAGGTIYVRGGTYGLDSTIKLIASGSSTAMFNLLAYPGEHVVLDFSAMSVAGTNRGMLVSGNYWHVKGFVIRRAGDNGMYITGSNNIVEQCAFERNADSGLQLNSGASYNQIINCDAFDNVDPKQGNADGFAAKLGVGTGNSFSGCRAWQNSDDGWDGYLRGTNGVRTTLENCWSFMNGYLSDGSTGAGNGNGFKMGGSDSANLEHHAVLRRCVAFDNLARGFDQNHDRGSMTLLNCSAYRNATNYSLAEVVDSGNTITLTNCLSLGFYGSVATFARQATNSWLSPFTVSDADFISLDTAGMRGPRKADGTLPDVTFLHLAAGSGLIDKGTIAGISYNGAAPDLGAFESDYPSSVTPQPALPTAARLEQNYPNPFNPTTTIQYVVGGVVAPSGAFRSGVEGRTTVTSAQWPVTSVVRLVVYDVLGRQVAVLVNNARAAGTYEVQFDGARLASGVYFYRLTAGTYTATKAMVLTK